ncbi:MAG: Trm112 family protein [Nitrospiraceae bacterium]
MGDGPGSPKKVNIDQDLLAILCCPDTKQEVRLADESLIERLNAAISKGNLKNKAQAAVTEKLDGGLIRSDGRILYPIREDIPVMLIEEGIPLDQATAT